MYATNVTNINVNEFCTLFTLDFFTLLRNTARLDPVYYFVPMCIAKGFFSLYYIILLVSVLYWSQAIQDIKNSSILKS